MTPQTSAWLVASFFLALYALGGCNSQAPAPEAVTSRMPGPPKDALPVTGPERPILAFGDSLFAGYGLEPGESYPARLENALRARGINARIANAGVSGDTTAAGRQRIVFTLDAQVVKPDLAIVELGGNDMLRSLPPAQAKANLATILGEIQRRGIPVLLMGMRAPPNLGRAYVSSFDAIYPELAKEYDAALIPFFLASTYDKPELIQADRVHPTAQGIDTLVGATVNDVIAALPG